MKIYVLTDEAARKGPFTKEELRKQLLAGKVKRRNLGWHSGIAEWTPLEELFSSSAESDGASEDENGASIFLMPPVPEAVGEGRGRKRKVYKVRSRTPRPFRDWLFRFLRVAR